MPDFRRYRREGNPAAIQRRGGGKLGSGNKVARPTTTGEKIRAQGGLRHRNETKVGAKTAATRKASAVGKQVSYRHGKRTGYIQRIKLSLLNTHIPDGGGKKVVDAIRLLSSHHAPGEPLLDTIRRIYPNPYTARFLANYIESYFLLISADEKVEGADTENDTRRKATRFMRKEGEGGGEEGESASEGEGGPGSRGANVYPQTGKTYPKNATLHTGPMKGVYYTTPDAPDEPRYVSSNIFDVAHKSLGPDAKRHEEMEMSAHREQAIAVEREHVARIVAARAIPHLYGIEHHYIEIAQMRDRLENLSRQANAQKRSRGASGKPGRVEVALREAAESYSKYIEGYLKEFSKKLHRGPISIARNHVVEIRHGLRTPIEIRKTMAKPLGMYLKAAWHLSNLREMHSAALKSGRNPAGSLSIRISALKVVDALSNMSDFRVTLASAEEKGVRVAQYIREHMDNMVLSTTALLRGSKVFASSILAPTDKFLAEVKAAAEALPKVLKDFAPPIMAIGGGTRSLAAAKHEGNVIVMNEETIYYERQMDRTASPKRILYHETMHSLLQSLYPDAAGQYEMFKSKLGFSGPGDVRRVLTTLYGRQRLEQGGTPEHILNEDLCEATSFVLEYGSADGVRRARARDAHVSGAIYPRGRMMDLAEEFAKIAKGELPLPVTSASPATPATSAPQKPAAPKAKR